ncbi:N-acetylneuraminate synthase [Paenibacillus sp. y28]|uniref:N-acetylneuraminate synthase n=1 Tax=Paenibacillus sp. y28 TaxID=3129110 RepID=UPI003019C487
MPNASTFIVAEIGVNHNGSVALAKQLIDAAVYAGADAVKFQSFQADSMVSEHASKAEYQRKTTAAGESQRMMLRKLQLSGEAHHELLAYCRQRHVQFLSTPFDAESVDLLVTELGIPMLKVASGEITNAPLLVKMAQSGKPLLVSTGMSTLGDIEQALAALAWGFTQPSGTTPSWPGMRDAYISDRGQEALARHVTLLHATSEYPAPARHANLRCLDTLAAAFQLPVGLSDHTEGIAVSIGAAARGAAVIEKHLTLDRALAGPDHRASLTPEEFRQLVSGIRQIEEALGRHAKLPTPEERGNAQLVRKSLVAARNIEAGENFTAGNVAVKRPGLGRSPFLYWDTLNTSANRPYRKDELLE